MWVEIKLLEYRVIKGQVILFVRMWVEMQKTTATMLKILVILFVRMWVEMTWMDLSIWSEQRHPLREDVSWNIRRKRSRKNERVILFVRMWVEIRWTLHGRSGSIVILFVRMWVEMLLKITLHWEIRSSSSWGCELKCFCEQWGVKMNESSSSWGCELKW